MAKQVTGTSKDDDGDITALCGTGFTVDKQTAIDETLRAGNGHDGQATPYFVNTGGASVNVRVYERTTGDPTTRYLRTDHDETTTNNLDNLPDC